jgi:hypothetical protein
VKKLSSNVRLDDRWMLEAAAVLERAAAQKE